LQEQFNILGTEEIYTESCCLAIQLNNGSFSFCIYEPEENRLLQLKRYRFDNLTTDTLDTILAQNAILEQPFHKIITSLDFGFNALLPEAMSKGDLTFLMYLEHADQQDHVITELIEGRGITNVYTTPPSILTWMVHNFPSSDYLHALSVAIGTVNNTPEEGLLRLYISEKSFDVVVFKGASLLLAKKYTYTVQEDVVFYLLKICEIYGLSQEKAELQISGLIDEDSALYKTIYDYFLLISLKQATWNDVISGLPAHYFTSLNELILCGSLQEA